MLATFLSNKIQAYLFEEKIDKPFRINQINQFIFQKKVFDFQKMSNIPAELRDYLSKNYSVLNIKPVQEKISKDGTRKYLFECSDHHCLESVILKDKNNRYTFCISTQVGCKMNCSFCQTGKMGFVRDLDYTEILSQVLYLSSTINKSFNIVFMGMGEPLDNDFHLTETIKILINSQKFNLSLSRITVSTCGIPEKIIQLFNQFPQINLAVSINSLDPVKREQIMPITKKYAINQLFEVLDRCFQTYHQRITLEYVLIKDFNMDQSDLDKFDPLNKKAYLINLIPANDPGLRPSEKNIIWFYNQLKNKGLNVTRRYRRGEDIQADCGQLFWEYRKNKI